MTTSRSYGQNCSLARAMDLLGERWTVLIVRELARGPKRFGDLSDSLAGIGTTMLAARLKRLEAAAVISRATPGPSAAGYQLTARGEHLAHALGELMLWGLGLPEMYQPQDQSRAVWLAMNMQAALDRAEHPAPAGTYAFHVDEEHFWLHVDGTGQPSTLRDGAPPHRPDATLTLSASDFYALAQGNSVTDLDIIVDGEPDRLTRFLELFRVSDPSDQEEATRARR